MSIINQFYSIIFFMYVYKFKLILTDSILLFHLLIKKFVIVFQQNNIKIIERSELIINLNIYYVIILILLNCILFTN